ncbi:BatD family protein [Glaciecola petra]|uniref:BatD family protein n=1 Tax=Glaciecola petra TaxID=3075602 RepID=A0ABU2ZQ18_9ALTE|nr:BatD family protein [Aestuariibacter sp. P117]MDT0594721.1 BatD family protein [Aestuariibacter sp. P117]
MRLLVIISFLMIHASALAQVTQLSASVDRNTVLIDEAIEFTLVATGSANRGDVDFSVLQSNFNVSRPSFSQSTQIINGSMTRTVSWRVRLFPLKTGRIDIPAFVLGGQQSRPFSVNILPASATNVDEPRDYYLTTEVNQERLYLQQQLLYTIKIYLSGDIQRGSLALPQLEGAIIEQIGEDEDYEEISNGIRYRVIKREIAIIPQSSGTFTIKGPIFEADVLTNSRRSFANFGRTKTISRRAPDVEIEVLPIPESYAFTWLPSEMVELSEEWQGDAQQLVVGEPITRTITLTALGLTKEQLPNIESIYHPSFKVYPEQPVLNTAEHRNSLVAQGVFNTAIIPSESGSYVLPEVKIPWFNVSSGRTEFAIIPARSVEVLERSQSSNPPVNQTQQTTEDLSNAPPITASNEQATGTISIHHPLVITLISTNILTLILLVIMWKSKRNKNIKQSLSNIATARPGASNEQDAFKNLKQYLEQGKSENINQYLDEWLSILLKQQHFSVSNSLAAFDNGHALEFYNQVLASQYSDNAWDINYSGFINALDKFREAALEKQNSSALASLY